MLPISINHENVPTLADFTEGSVWVPVIIFCAGVYVSVFGLRRPDKEALREKLSLSSVIVLGLLAMLDWYQGAVTNKSSRMQNERFESMRDDVRSFGTVLSYSADLTPEQVLDKAISKFAQPGIISQPQMAVLAHQIALFKGDIPAKVVIQRSKTNSDNGTDYQVYYPIQEAFERNGLQPQITYYVPKSVAQTGILIRVPKGMPVPTYVEKLRSAFILAGIHDVRLDDDESMSDVSALTIVIAPPPI